MRVKALPRACPFHPLTREFHLLLGAQMSALKERGLPTTPSAQLVEELAQEVWTQRVLAARAAGEGVGGAGGGAGLPPDVLRGPGHRPRKDEKKKKEAYH